MSKIFKLTTFILTVNTYILFACSCFGQQTTAIEDTLIFIEPEVPPVFKNGGDVGLKKFIKENLHYPKTGECISGKVYVGFTVDTIGNVKDIEIKRGITPASNEEAIRVIKMLTFIPGTRFGKPVEMKMVLPINFTIER